MLCETVRRWFLLCQIKVCRSVERDWEFWCERGNVLWMRVRSIEGKRLVLLHSSRNCYKLDFATAYLDARLCVCLTYNLKISHPPIYLKNIENISKFMLL